MKRIIKQDIDSFFDGKCGEQSCWFGFEGEGEGCRRCLAAYLNEKGYCRQDKHPAEETLKEFAKFLVDRAEGGVLYVSNIADLCCEFFGNEDIGGVLAQAHIQAHYEAIYALADMVCQFGYSTTFRNQRAVCNGGLSALEVAFGALQDCGCRLNSNGTITLKNLFEFQEKFDKLRRGENYGQSD